jgi:methionyl-tRNA formyltransferase
VDLLVAVGWRYLVPKEVYTKARLGAYVFHDSLLPEYRGFSPTVWAIVNGEDHTGATLFAITEAVDAGDIVDQERVSIGPTETIATVMNRVNEAYLRLMVKNLPRLLDGTAPRHPQDHSRATYTCRRKPEDNRIPWQIGTREILNLIRGVTSPYSGAFTSLNGRKLMVWAAELLPDAPKYIGRIPGRVVEVRPGVGAVVLTGNGALLLTQVQVEGEPVVSADKLLTSLSLTLQS